MDPEAIALALQSKLSRMKAHVGTLFTLDPKARGTVVTDTTTDIIQELAQLYGEVTSKSHEFAKALQANQYYDARAPVKAGSSSRTGASNASAAVSRAAGDQSLGTQFAHVLPGFRSLCVQLQQAWTAALRTAAPAAAAGLETYAGTARGPLAPDDDAAHALIHFHAFTSGSPHSSSTNGVAASSFAAAAAAATPAASGPTPLPRGTGGAAIANTAALTGGTLHAVQFRFGTLFSVLVSFRSNRYFQRLATGSTSTTISTVMATGASQSAAPTPAPSPARAPTPLPELLSVSVGTAREHQAAVESRGRTAAGGPPRFVVDSRYNVFRKMSARALQAHTRWIRAMRGAGRQLANQGALARTMLWLVYYHNVFTEPCRACRRLMNVAPSATECGIVMMPPTCRDFDTGEAFHETCEDICE